MIRTDRANNKNIASILRDVENWSPTNTMDGNTIYDILVKRPKTLKFYIKEKRDKEEYNELDFNL